MAGQEITAMFVTRKWAPAVGGMETYSMRLTEELARLVDLECVVLPGRQDGSPPGTTALLRFPLTFLRRYMARPSVPDILHLGDLALWPLGLVAWPGRLTRIVISAHGTDVAYHRRGGLKGRLYGAYLRFGASVLRRAKIIANSRATRDVLRETGWNDAAVVPLATDMTGPPPTGEHNGRILFAGRLVKRKGCAWFIREVLPLLPEEIELDVAGTGWDEDEKAALDNPRVRYLGALNQVELGHAYREALCVIVPNIAVPSGEYEGFGLVAPEAASAGGIVFAAATGGLTDALIDGETGFLVGSGDVRAWVNAIVRIIGWDLQTRRSFVAPSQTLAKEAFAWQRMAKQTVDAYPP